MSDLKYYRDERNKYPEALATPVDLATARKVVNELVFEFDIKTLPSLNVTMNRAKHRSFYRPSRDRDFINPRWGVPNGRKRGGEGIYMARSMMDWLTVAHELAHALHCHDYNFRSRRYSPNYDRSRGGGPLPKERWHDHHHATWMRCVITKLETRGLIPMRGTSKANRLEAIRESAERHHDPIAASSGTGNE